MSAAPGTRRRPAAALLAFAVFGVSACLASACSASPAPAPSPSSTPPASSAPPTSAAPSSPPPASTAPASTPPAASGPQPCATRALQVKPGLSQSAAGSTYLQIVFTNISSRTCTLYGYPGVSLAGGSPVSQIGLAAKENPQQRKLVTLNPGGQASALLRIVTAQNFPKSRCGPAQATYLQVYPPNQTTPVYVAYNVVACTKLVPLLTVDVAKPGSGG